MPELPEVEVVKRSLNKVITNLTIRNVIIHNKSLRYEIDTKKFKKIIGSKIILIKRKSKYILINLNNNYTILVHLGMTGKITIVNSLNQKIKTSFYYNNLSYQKHDHLELKLSNKIKIIYNDVRKFGFIKIIKTNDINYISHFINLGPEPLSKKFNFNYFQSRIKGKKISVKDLLMDQKFVSGLGNIYVNEAIFYSKINPQKKVQLLTKKNIQILIKNIKRILIKSINKGGSSIKNFNDTEGKRGNFQQFFGVYGKSTKKCIRKKCKGIIKKIRISNRSTFFCEICQKY